MLFTSVAISQSNYFNFGFTTLNWKSVYMPITVLSFFSIAYQVPTGFPRITKQPPSLIKKSTGEDAMFECTVTGTPDPTISWMKDNVPVKLSNPKYSTPSRGVLQITNVEPEDSGVFECVATNNLGMIYSRRLRLQYEGLC